MTIEKNVERMFWRLSNGNFTPNQNDLKAMTEIVEWINREKEKTVKDNYMFAKLYCNQFIQEIEFYKDIDFAQRSLHELLQKPIIEHYDKFHERLNFVELMKYSKSIGLSDKHPAFLTEDERENDKRILKEHEAKYIQYSKGIWEYDKVQKSLNNQLTEAINRYKNLP
jgi:hypothetical protein